MKSSPRKVLLFGGSGLIGSELAWKLTRAGIDVLIADKKKPQFSGFNFTNLDITCEKCVIDIISKYHPDVIVHLASPLTTITESDPLEACKSGVLGSAYILEHSTKVNVNRIIIASSLAVYGSGSKYYPNKPLDEDVPPAPNTIYGAMKLCVENLAAHYRNSGNTDISVIRLSVVLSSKRRTGYTAILVESLRSISQAEEIILPAPPDTPIDWIHLDDAVDVFFRAILHRDELLDKYNVTADRITLQEIGNIIKGMNPGIRIKYADQQPLLLPPPQGFSTTRVKNHLKWNPKLSIKDVVKEIIKHKNPF
ncbi:MAG: NAD(P)-dependent oxidoreductase [Desulfurococcales archaeon]|nr:NAD(P)-dependent oxidoreductase [Desulfurococcales archaeon]